MPTTTTPPTEVRRTRKAEQAAATKAILLRVARELFTAKGYGATGTEEIVERSGMTMGALYYHFRDKRDLFRAVFEELEQEFDDIGREAAMSKADAWEAFVAGCTAIVDACRRPDIHQICMLDAPSVLGWELWRKIDGQHSLASMSMGLRMLMQAGFIEQEPVEPLAALLIGMVNEAGLAIAHADDPMAMRDSILAALGRFLDRLRINQ